MRIYISGPITGHDDHREAFGEAEDELWAKYPGAEIFNPASAFGAMPDYFSHEDYMRLCMTVLPRCDAIYMLRGWEDSLGAQREYGYALGAGIKVEYQGGEERQGVSNG